MWVNNTKRVHDPKSRTLVLSSMELVMLLGLQYGVKR